MKLREIAAAVALMAPAVAYADPITAVALVLQIAGYAKAAAIVMFAGMVFGSVKARRDAKKRDAQTRARFNAGLSDRTVSVARADAPWQIVYGRCVVGGFPSDVFGTDNTRAGEDNTPFTKADGLKHVVLELAHHPCEAIHEVYIEGVALGALDVDGYPTGGDYGGSRTDTKQITFNTTATLVLPASAIVQAYSYDSEFNTTPRTVTITGGGLTLNGPPGVDVICDYTLTIPTRTVRVQKMLGAFDQPVNPYLASVAPTRYTANHRLRGITYIVVTFDLEDPRWQGGVPNITADVSGARLYDPRLDSTVGGIGSHRADNPATWAWSDNPALCVRDFLTQQYGFECDAADVDVSSVIAAANACDALISLTVGGTTETNQKTYTCNGAFTTEQAKEAVLQDLAECMAGTVTDGAGWSVQAGAWTAPVMTLTDDDLAGLVEVIQSDTPIDELFNGARGSQLLRSAQAPSDINPYQNATFVTADGRALWTDVELPFTDHLARARNLSRIMVERNRAGQVLRYPAKFRAWRLRIGDRVTLSHAPYGITSLTYRVTDWQWSPGSPVMLTLQRDAASIWDLADAATPNPTPSTDLPNPWAVATVSSVTASSGNATLLRTFDGSVVPRILVQWGAITDPFVLDGGSVEVLWRRNEDLNWTLIDAPAADRAAFVVGVAEFDRVLIEVRARNSRSSLGPSTFVVHEAVGKSAAPGNVAGFSGSVNKGRIVWSWNTPTDVDYSATEVRATDADWGSDSVQPLFRGRSNQWPEVVSTTGARTRHARHLDESGNPSASSVTASVTVNAGDLVQDGATGSSVFVGTIYSTSASAPSAPTGGNFNFSTGVLTPPSGWQLAVPNASAAGSWLTTFTFVGTTPTSTVTAGTWAAPIAAPRAVPVNFVISPGRYCRDTGVSGSGGAATAAIRFNSAGTIARASNTAGTTFSDFSTWFSGTVGATYYIRFTTRSTTGGSVTGSNTGWLELSTDRSVSLSVTALNTGTALIDYQIASDSAGNDVLAEGTVDLFAESTT